MRTALLLALSFSLLAATATAAKGPRPRGQENLRLGRATIAVLDSMHATGKPMSQELYVAHDGTRGKLATASGRAMARSRTPPFTKSMIPMVRGA